MTDEELVETPQRWTARRRAALVLSLLRGGDRGAPVQPARLRPPDARLGVGKHAPLRDRPDREEQVRRDRRDQPPGGRAGRGGGGAARGAARARRARLAA